MFLFFKFLCKFTQNVSMNRLQTFILSAVNPSKGIHFWYRLGTCFGKGKRQNAHDILPRSPAETWPWPADMFLIQKLLLPCHNRQPPQKWEPNSTCKLAGALRGNVAQNLYQNRVNIMVINLRNYGPSSEEFLMSYANWFEHLGDGTEEKMDWKKMDCKGYERLLRILQFLEKPKDIQMSGEGVWLVGVRTVEVVLQSYVMGRGWGSLLLRWRQDNSFARAILDFLFSSLCFLNTIPISSITVVQLLSLSLFVCES